MEIKIFNDFQTFDTKIIVFQREGNINGVYNLYTGIIKEIKQGRPIPEEFVMKIPNHLVSPLFKALAEALDKQGIKTEMDAKIEGKFEATKYHLEDLRIMLKLNEK